MLDLSKPERMAILFLWSGCFQNPRESANGSTIRRRRRGKLQAKQCQRSCGKLQHCVHDHACMKGVARNCNRTMPKAPCLTVLKELGETAGTTLSKATCQKVQGVAGNRNRRLKSNCRRPGWTTTIGKSQITGAFRKSSRIFIEN